MHNEYQKMDGWIVSRFKFYWPILLFIVMAVSGVSIMYSKTESRVEVLEAQAKEVPMIQNEIGELQKDTVVLEAQIPEIGARLDRMEKKIDQILLLIK